MKITQAGQPCRHCGVPVERRIIHAKPPKYKRGGYYFEWWLQCPACQAIYMVDQAKRYFLLA